MTEFTIDISKEPEYIKGYLVVNYIYSVRDKFLFPEKDSPDDDDIVEYDELIVNENILNLIDEINFIYIKDNEHKDKIRKVGNLLNFKVYLDPLGDNNIKMFSKGEKMIYIEIIL